MIGFILELHRPIGRTVTLSPIRHGEAVGSRIGIIVASWICASSLACVWQVPNPGDRRDISADAMVRPPTPIVVSRPIWLWSLGSLFGLRYRARAPFCASGMDAREGRALLMCGSKHWKRDKMDKIHGFINFHGHLMALNKDRELKFISIFDDHAADYAVALKDYQDIVGQDIKLSNEAGHEADAMYRIEPASEAGFYLFFRENRLIGADRKGDYSHPERAKTWELFFPVAFSDLECLRTIVRSYWHIVGRAGSQIKIAMKEFSFIVDDEIFPFDLNFPLSDNIENETLRLTNRDFTTDVVKLNNEDVRKYISINYKGNYANRILQYLTAKGIQKFAPEAHILNKMPDIGGGILDTRSRLLVDGLTANTGNLWSIDIEGLGECLHKGEVESVTIDSYTFCVDHYPTRQECRNIFSGMVESDAIKGYGADKLVCHIRGDDILRGIHPSYTPLPSEYYKMLADDCGLDLVFYGQVEENDYTNKLRREFPDAEFSTSQDAAVDFEVLRRSKNLALSISTFSWLAAWLGEANIIYMPIGGMFDPACMNGQIFIPVGDPAYRYTRLPGFRVHNLFADPEAFWESQKHIADHMKIITNDEAENGLREYLEKNSKRKNLKGFNSERYLQPRLHQETDVMQQKYSALTAHLRS